MSRETIVISAGIWVFVLPFLGLPESWRVVLFIFTGIGLVVLGFIMRAEVLARGVKKDGRQPFTENGHRQSGAEVRMPVYERQTEEKIG